MKYIEFNFKFSGEAGWFKGNPFVLFQFHLWESMQGDGIRIIGICFLHFSLALYLWRKDA